MAFAVSQGAATVSPASVDHRYLRNGEHGRDARLDRRRRERSRRPSKARRSRRRSRHRRERERFRPRAPARTPQAPAAGAVLPSVAGTGVCLSGGASGADYAIVAFNSNPDSELVQTSFAIKGSGITTLTTADLAPTTGVSASRAPTTGASLSSRLPVRRGDVRTAFDLQLRETARRELTRLIPGARRAYAASRSSAVRASTSFRIGTPTVGHGVAVERERQSARAATRSRSARASSRSRTTAIVVADTLNPTANGFTDGGLQLVRGAVRHAGQPARRRTTSARRRTSTRTARSSSSSRRK